MVLVVLILRVIFISINDTLYKSLVHLDVVTRLRIHQTVIRCVLIELVEFLQILVVFSVFSEIYEFDSWMR